MLPKKDQTKSNREQGLYRKFNVERTDGSDRDGGKHEGCEYFVLDTKHDRFAAGALIAYARACEDTHPELAADIRSRYLKDVTESFLTSHELEICGTDPEILHALADHHSWMETEADAMGADESTKFHEERRKALRAEAERIVASWDL